jgi:hypothetical protein
MYCKEGQFSADIVPVALVPVRVPADIVPVLVLVPALVDTIPNQELYTDRQLLTIARVCTAGRANTVPVLYRWHWYRYEYRHQSHTDRQLLTIAQIRTAGNGQYSADIVPVPVLVPGLVPRNVWSQFHPNYHIKITQFPICTTIINKKVFIQVPDIG